MTVNTRKKKTYLEASSEEPDALLNKSLSFLLASNLTRDIKEPVPHGTSLPTITFSFKPNKVSTLPETEASVRTLVVS